MKSASTIFVLLFSLYANVCAAGGVYQEPDAFIDEIFSDGNFEQKVIWPDKAMQLEMEKILGHKYKGLRIRYWLHGTKSAWILDEIGKDKPITTGIVIDDNKIERIRILIFRESRGWEVRHAFFTDQFSSATLLSDNQLDNSIDNISGATLSVRAITKLSRIALLLHKKIMLSDKS